MRPNIVRINHLFELPQNLIWNWISDKENMVKILIDEKPDMVDVANDHGKTSLFLAAEVNGKFNNVESTSYAENVI